MPRDAIERTPGVDIAGVELGVGLLDVTNSRSGPGHPRPPGCIRGPFDKQCFGRLLPVVGCLIGRAGSKCIVAVVAPVEWSAQRLLNAGVHQRHATVLSCLPKDSPLRLNAMSQRACKSGCYALPTGAPRSWDRRDWSIGALAFARPAVMTCFLSLRTFQKAQRWACGVARTG